MQNLAQTKLIVNMDPITLITSAMTILLPYLVKSGEKIAEEMGASLWTWLKGKFGNNKHLPISPLESDKNAIQLQLMSEIAQNAEFALALEKKIQELKQESCNQGVMKVENNATVEKQVNITNNSGSISL